jgi:hypothetical protein
MIGKVSACHAILRGTQVVTMWSGDSSAISTGLVSESDGYFTPVRRSLMFGWKCLEQFVDRLLCENQSPVFLFRIEFLYTVPSRPSCSSMNCNVRLPARPAAHLRQVLQIPCHMTGSIVAVEGRYTQSRSCPRR